MNGYGLQFKLDTGAEVTAISEDAYKTIQSLQILPSTKFSWTISTATPLHWTVSWKIQSQRQSSNTTSVCRQRAKVQSPRTSKYHGTDTSHSFRHDRGNRRHQKQFPSLFEGLGNLGEPFEIHLKEGVVPHCIYTPRKVPLPLREKVKQELDKMESMGVIEKSSDPTPWCAGMVVVPKRDSKIGICVVMG